MYIFHCYIGRGTSESDGYPSYYKGFIVKTASVNRDGGSMHEMFGNFSCP
jgi:hypothetical protein